MPNLLDEPLETLRYLQDGVTLSERTWSRTTRDAAGNETDRCTWTASPTEWCHPASDPTWTAPVPISRSSTSYDARNQRTRLFVPGQGETTYDPAANYQVDKVYTSTRTNGTGQVTAEHVADHSYDTRDRLTGISQSGCIVNADTHTCTSLPVVTGTTTYLYDDVGNRTRVVEDNGSGAITRYYCYDARNQLAKVSATVADCSTAIETYAYDAAGNRTSAAGRTFTYDAQGQLASCTPTCGTPTFDPEGRLTGIRAASGDWSYQYDAEPGPEALLPEASVGHSCADLNRRHHRHRGNTRVRTRRVRSWRRREGPLSITQTSIAQGATLRGGNMSDSHNETLVRTYFHFQQFQDDDSAWAWDRVELEGWDQPLTKWSLIIDLIAGAPDEKQLLLVAAGPLEQFLEHFGATHLEFVRYEAGRNARLRTALSTVWTRDPSVTTAVRAMLVPVN